MSQNRELSELAARVIVDTSANTTTVNNNLIINKGLQANGGYGTTGQALTTNGTGVYWSTIVGTNTDAQYVWSNTHTFNANVTIATTSGLKANGSVGTSGQFLTSNGSSVYWSTGYSSALRQTFTGDGSTTSFTVSGGYNPNNIDVFGNGVRYTSSEVTTSSGSAIVFGTAPPNGVIIDVVGYYLNNLTTVNTAQAYVWTGPHTFNANVSMTSNLIIGTAVGISANGGYGTSGQALTTNGTGVYWSTIVGTNTAASYIWTNTHTFNANVTIGTTAGLNANGSVGTSGQVLTSNGSSIYWATATTDPTPTVFLLMGA